MLAATQIKLLAKEQQHEDEGEGEGAVEGTRQLVVVNKGKTGSAAVDVVVVEGEKRTAQKGEQQTRAGKRAFVFVFALEGERRAETDKGTKVAVVVAVVVVPVEARKRTGEEKEWRTALQWERV